MYSVLQVTDVLSSVVSQHSTVAIQLLPVQPQSKQLMTSDQDTKVVAEPQGQRVQEGKDSAHLVSVGRGQNWPGASLSFSRHRACESEEWLWPALQPKYRCYILNKFMGSLVVEEAVVGEGENMYL